MYIHVHVDHLEDGVRKHGGLCRYPVARVDEEPQVVDVLVYVTDNVRNRFPFITHHERAYS